MPNKISEFLNPPYRTTMDAVEYRDQCRKHAALADRLVEAVKEYHEVINRLLFPGGEEWNEDAEARRLLKARKNLTAVLREIESEEKDEHTN